MTDQQFQPTPPHMPGIGHPSPTVSVSTSLAVVTLVLGILGVAMCPLLGIIAVITGIIALTRVSREPHRYGGRGMAIAGLSCGAASMFTGVLLIAILLPSLARARELSKRLVCASNMKAIGTTLMIYTNDHPGQGIPTLDFLVELGEITEKGLICPSSGPERGNYILLPMDPSSPVAHDTVMLYEPKSNHGNEGGNFLFSDGHVSFERAENYDELVQHARTRGP